MCIYVQGSLAGGMPMLLHPAPNQRTAAALYQFSYPDPSVPSDATVPPNGAWAQPSHPSDRLVGTHGVAHESLLPAAPSSAGGIEAHMRSHPQLYAMADTMWSVRPDADGPAAAAGGVFNASEHHLVATPLLPGVSEASLQPTGRLRGYTTCEWLRACDRGVETTGSRCSTARDGATRAGFCFESATGSLECGRAVSLEDARDSFAGVAHPVRQAGESGVTMRCPQGAPVTSYAPLGTRAPRLLLGGCMVPTDPAYDSLAEVHAPETCARYDAAASAYRKGCLVFGATNYDADARQVGHCHYQTAGCTNATALNYNSEASIDDGSCIMPVYGCTLAREGYHGVAPQTPGYQSLRVGVPGTDVSSPGGLRAFPAYPTVVAHDAAANTLRGCVVALEGCTDSTAANYDEHATLNSNTWCVPRVEGCAMPPTRHADGAVGAPLPRDPGGAVNYDPKVTVNLHATCVIARRGCTDSLALNFDPDATIDDGSCLRPYPGCLDRAAYNFNCTAQGSATCTDAAPRPTVHEPAVCVYSASPSPPPPSPPDGCWACEYDHSIVVAFQAAGSVEDYSSNSSSSAYNTTIIGEAVAASAGLDSSSGVLVEVAPASVRITVTLPAPSLDQARQMQQQLSRTLGTAEAAATLLGLPIQSVPLINVVATRSGVAPPAPPPEPLGIMERAQNVALVCVAGVCVLLFVAFCTLTRRGTQARHWCVGCCVRFCIDGDYDANGPPTLPEGPSKGIVSVVPAARVLAPHAEAAAVGASGRALAATRTGGGGGPGSMRQLMPPSSHDSGGGVGVLGLSAMKASGTDACAELRDTTGDSQTSQSTMAAAPVAAAVAAGGGLRRISPNSPGAMATPRQHGGAQQAQSY